MDIKPDPEVERVARALADMLGYDWDGLNPGSAVDKGYPLWAHNQVMGRVWNGGQQDLRNIARKLLYPLLRHSDDMAVDSFAGHMKQKLAAKRLDGRHGWNNKDLLHGGISGDELSVQLRRHVEKGDPLDVANFCMMLYHRGEPITGRSSYANAKEELAEAQVEPVKAKLHGAAYTDDDLRVEKLFEDIVAELTKARSKFPGKNVTFAALVEEVGELATATFEESRDRVRKEAVQVAVMAMRVVLDGDHTFDEWRSAHGLDPLIEKAGPDLTKRYHVAEAHALTGESLGIVATFDQWSDVEGFLMFNPGHIWKDTQPGASPIPPDDVDRSRDDRIL